MGDHPSEEREVSCGPRRWRLTLFFWVQCYFRYVHDAPLFHFWFDLGLRGIEPQQRHRLAVARIERDEDGWKIYGIVCATASFRDTLWWLKQGYCIRFEPGGRAGVATAWDYAKEDNPIDPDKWVDSPLTRALSLRTSAS